MNARNLLYILEHNPRGLYPRVDDKAVTKELCGNAQVPVPETYALISNFGDIASVPQRLVGYSGFVIKPARGAGGRGVLVIRDQKNGVYERHNGELLPWNAVRQHLSSVLSGLYSLAGRPDRAIVEQLIQRHAVFDPIAVGGTPDIRIIVLKDVPRMAMLRLPTNSSGGRANLHQGAIGAGVDIRSGVTTGGVIRNQAISIHPDTEASITGVQIPFWEEIIDMTIRLSKSLGLGYIGVDIVLDAARGPIVLEANARPGLAIQIANRMGLIDRLNEEY